jgi:hypothetical protein
MAGDHSLGGRFVRTLVMWVMFFIPVYPVAGFVDAVILNLIEFWTGKPIMVASNDPDAMVQYQMLSENEMRVDIKSEKGIRSFHVFRDHPGEFFLKERAGYIAIVMPESLNDFDLNGRTSLSCLRESAAIVCSEGKNEQAVMQTEIDQTQYNRLQYRTRLALGAGLETATR